MDYKQIKTARLLLGLTQSELAAKLGWSTRRHVGSLERNEKRVTDQTILAIKCLLKDAGKYLEFELASKRKV